MDLTSKRFPSEEDREEKDFISDMPDELLGMILSRLFVKEAARTTVLSRRWISALDLFSGKLIFDPSLIRQIYHELSEPELQVRFVSLVNQILFNSLRSPTFQQLIIWFFLSSDWATDLDNWLLLAFRKRVDYLDLNLSHYWGCPRSPNADCIPIETYSNYSFPLHLFRHSTFASLKSLGFRSVEVSEEAIHWFLHDCPNLEDLRLGDGCLTKFTSLRLFVPSLKLRHLRLNCKGCETLTDIEISTGSLVSLVIIARTCTRLSLDIAPSLFQLGFGRSLSEDLTLDPTKYSSILTKLKSLKLSVWTKRWNYELYQLKNLKHMVLIMNLSEIGPVQVWSTFLKGAPFVQRLLLQFIEGHDSEPPTREPEKVREKSPYKELKEVKIFGFHEDIRIQEAIFYLVENCLSLEKIEIDTCIVAEEGLYYEAHDREARRESALRLNSQLPATLSYTIE